MNIVVIDDEKRIANAFFKLMIFSNSIKDKYISSKLGISPIISFIEE